MDATASSIANATQSIKRLLPWLVAIAFFMETLDTTIINTAVPSIAANLGVGPLSLKAALTSYMLSLAVFIPVSGWVADRYGTRRVFAAAVGIFTMGSLFCGMALNLPMLVMARVVQGLGGAMMMPVGRIAMVRSFPKSEMLAAMSFVAIPGLVGPMLGPLVGGLIVHYLHWRMIFFVNLPIGIGGLYLIFRYMPDYRGAKPAPLDLQGFILFGFGIALLSYVLEIFGEHSLGVRSATLLFLLSLCMLLLYWRHSLRHPHPVVRLDLFRVATFRIAVTGGFLARLGAGGMPFLMPLLYQIGLGFTPVQAGLLIMPQSIAALSMKVIVQRVLTRFGYRRILMVNTALVGGMIALFSTVSVTTPVWLIIAQGFLFGLFSSLQFSCMNTLVFADLEEHDTSMGSSISSAMQQLSMSFGVAVASLATAYFLLGNAHPSVSQMSQAIHHTVLVLGILTVVSTLVFLHLDPNAGGNVSQHRSR